MSRYEDSLWEALAERHADELNGRPIPEDRPPRRRPVAIVGAGAIVAAMVVAGVLAIAATTNTPRAWAVATKPDGSVAVTLRRSSAIPALNARLKALGIRATVVSQRPDCKVARTVVAPAPPGMGRHLPSAPGAGGQTVLRPAQIKRGTQRMIVAAPGAHGKMALVQSVARQGGTLACVASMRQIAGGKIVISGSGRPGTPPPPGPARICLPATAHPGPRPGGDGATGATTGTAGTSTVAPGTTTTTTTLAPGTTTGTGTTPVPPPPGVPTKPGTCVTARSSSGASSAWATPTTPTAPAPA